MGSCRRPCAGANASAELTNETGPALAGDRLQVDGDVFLQGSPGSNGRENNELPGHSIDRAVSDAEPAVAPDLHIRRFHGHYYRDPKKQQMRWSPRGAHLLLQIRTRILNDTLTNDYRRWYPHFTPTPDRQHQAA
jgi:hypothetical protein